MDVTKPGQYGYIEAYQSGLRKAPGELDENSVCFDGSGVMSQIARLPGTSLRRLCIMYGETQRKPTDRLRSPLDRQRHVIRVSVARLPGTSLRLHSGDAQNG